MSTHVSWIKCETLPDIHKGRWDYQHCVRITFKATYNGKDYHPITRSREAVKTYLRTFVHDFKAEKGEPKDWFEHYLDSLEEVEKGVWEACILQAWLD